jgi:hypothetical protein
MPRIEFTRVWDSGINEQSRKKTIHGVEGSCVLTCFTPLKVPEPFAPLDPKSKSWNKIFACCTSQRRSTSIFPLLISRTGYERRELKRLWSEIPRKLSVAPGMDGNSLYQCFDKRILPQVRHRAETDRDTYRYTAMQCMTRLMGTSSMRRA